MLGCNQSDYNYTKLLNHFLNIALIDYLQLLAGILFTNSPTPLEQYNSSISSARALGGIGGHLHPGHDHETDHEHNDEDHSEYPDQSKEAVEQHGPDAQSDEAPSNVSEESNQMYGK